LVEVVVDNNSLFTHRPLPKRAALASEQRCWQVRGRILSVILELTLIRNIGGAGLVGGALLMDAFEDHDEREREEGFDQGRY
jgi:hypothetical protein